MTERRRRLVEVAFPLEEVSEHSRREKNVRHAHISTLHIWWARRPLAACRAFIYASLVDDPDTDHEREELLKEVADLASWDAVRKPDQVVRPREEGGSGLTGAQLLERARRRILECNGGKPPRLLDPFAGGGAIPLEALRLGCEVEASDLNPVAVLILKGTVEYPQKYGRPLAEQVDQKRRGERDSIAGVNGDVPGYIREAAGSQQARFTDGNLVDAYGRNPLATDVRYWGHWMLERAREELNRFYPPDPDGSVPLAYLWSRTVPCPNCHAEMPLIRQYWLARKEKKRVALKPMVDHANNGVDFEVVEGPNVTGDPADATTSRGDTRCLLCRQVVKAAYVREASSRGEMGARLTAVVLEAKGGGGKRYRADRPDDLPPYQRAAKRLAELDATHKSDLPLVPGEPIARETLGLRIDAFGLDSWGKLFNVRQLLALTTLARLARDSHAEVLRTGTDPEYARAIATYLSLALSRYCEFACTLARWKADAEAIVGALARQALPMVWDYAEHSAVTVAGGSFAAMIDRVAEATAVALTDTPPAKVKQRDARVLADSAVDTIITDPPYYDAIDYAGLSDFFYVWLKRSIATVHRDLFSLPLTPKKEQAIMASEGGDPVHRERYVSMMKTAFAACGGKLHRNTNNILGVVFAHSDPDAWATLIDGLLSDSLVPDASWPIDTEMETKVSAESRANLRTSVWMACRPRNVAVGDAFLGDVLQEMQPVIRERLLYFWSKGIRGADFFISAIGPALSVFGRHSRVLRPDGSEVTVRDFLDLVRRECTQVALEQVLQGADLGVVDPVTRQYVTWVWSYSRAPLEAGETIALCLATGADYHQVVRAGSMAAEVKEKSKKVVKLRTIGQRGREDETLGEDSPARPAPLIDQLQRAAYLWGLNRTEDLAGYRARLGETRWAALRVLGQAVAECLPDGDEDRRLINGLLGSNVMARAARVAPGRPAKPASGPRLPGFEEE